MRAVATRVNHPLRNPLVIEMENLLAKMEVLDEGRSTRAHLDRVLVVGYRTSLRGGQDRHFAVRDLVQLAALTAVQFLIVDGGGFSV